MYNSEIQKSSSEQKNGMTGNSGIILLFLRVRAVPTYMYETACLHICFTHTKGYNTSLCYKVARTHSLVHGFQYAVDSGKFSFKLDYNDGRIQALGDIKMNVIFHNVVHAASHSKNDILDHSQIKA